MILNLNFRDLSSTKIYSCIYTLLGCIAKYLYEKGKYNKYYRKYSKLYNNKITLFK